MPDKEIKSEEVTKKDAPKKSSSWIVWTVIAGILVLVIIGGGAAWAMRAWMQNHQPAQRPGLQLLNNTPRYSNQRTFYVQQSSSDGLTTTSTTTQYTQTQGVVTAVSGSSITVAGGGKSQAITTNSSTTYVGGTKPAVNDSVIVTGTKSGSTITATQVEVLN